MKQLWFLRKWRDSVVGSPTLERRLQAIGVSSISTLDGPGMARVGRLVLRYTDPGVLYTELKDIFLRKIYDFEFAGRSPKILDCGSHIGVSVLFFKTKYPDARITAFEPDPNVFPVLHKNTLDNGFDDVTLVNAALATQSGWARFVSDQDASHLIEDESSLEVRTVKLSDYIDGPIDFIKMNIEGSELAVLRETGSKLQMVREMVIEYHGFESHPQYLHDLLALLDRHRFRYLIHDFDEETNPATKPPIRLDENTRFFLLVYAKRLGE